MDAPASNRPEIPVPLDEQAETVVLAAANIGARIEDDVFVSYTTLLVGLLFTRLEPAEGWHTEAFRALRVDMLTRRDKGLSRSIAEAGAQAAADPKDRVWPKGRPLLSASARNVLSEAYAAAQIRRGTGAVVAPADIMASYLFVIPDTHRQQAQDWGLAGEAGRLIASLLPGAAPAAEPSFREAPTAAELPGYDAAASTVLRLAFVLGGRRREKRGTFLASETLLVAIAECAPDLDERDGAEAMMLAGMLGANDNPQSSYYQRRAPLYDVVGSLAADAAKLPPTFPALSRNAQEILDDARVFAKRMSRSEVVGVRHLVTALITERDGTDRATGAVAWLRDAAVEMDGLREGLARIIAHRHPADDHAAWRELLLGRDVPLIATARADVIPDDPRAEDTLDLRRYSDAIGALITAAEQKPPLSIAVFGAWGSGKSFFMRMIRAAVADFAGAGVKAAEAKQTSPFLRRVVQIEFNAWHYAEGNLWASLVHAVLVGLERELTPADPQVTPFELMLNQLHLREAEKLEAEQRLHEAERRLIEAEAAMRQADQQLASRRGDEGNVKSVADVLKAVQEEALARLGPPEAHADPQAWISSVGDSVAKAATYLGRPELAAQVPALTRAANDVAGTTEALQVQVGAVRELLDEAKASAERGLGLLGWLAQTRMSVREKLAIGLGAAALLAVFVCLALFLESRGGEVAALVTGVAAFFAPLAGAIAAVAAWAKRHMADASRAFAVLGSIRDRVEARQAQQLSERDSALLAARRATAEAEAEAARRRAEAQAAKAAVDKAKEDLRQSVSAERLKRFVAQRLAEGDYQRHLGLIHTIRTDLERLQDILETVHPKEKDYETQAPVERIVLYIDDLDRCPPARVVEVLEAVHLLLAFKLFVVVVGVDVRWVQQALRERYPEQLGDREGIASPMDYLEKVFQIPFWLPAMDAAGGRRLLESAVGKAVAPDPQPRVSARPAAPVAAQPADARGEGVTAAASPTPETASAPAPATPAPPVTADIRAVAEALLLGKDERERLLDMAAAIGASPRRAKRFANLYRLMKASLSRAERRGFVLDGGRAGSYDAALLLLAVATGAPRAAPGLIAALAEAPGEDAAAYLAERFERVGAVRPAETAAFAAARELVSAAKDQAAIGGHLRFWAPRVMRFAFDGQAPALRAPEPPGAAPAPQTPAIAAPSRPRGRKPAATSAR